MTANSKSPLRSLVEPVVWPAIQSGRAAELMALQRQFDQSQFWSAEALHEAQFSQLTKLVDHAMRTVPAYGARFKAAGIVQGKPLTAKQWHRLPILTRNEVRDLGEKLYSNATPPSFGALSTASSGGSSGIPVTVRKTALDELFWQAINIREELWHRANPQGTIARLRGIPNVLPREFQAAARSTHGAILPDWGPPQNLIWKTGKLGLIHPSQPLEVQAKFLQKLQPEYLYTFPTYLRPLLAHFSTTGKRLTSLKTVSTASEVVDDSLRQACFEIFGCKIVQNYTSGETGYIALQCPECTNLHVQSEIVHVEIIDRQGNPCAPGEIGRVIVTPLHNYTMPLLRYEIGDEAEFGGPCSCGRGLPVLTRIVGRNEDYLALPSGERRRVNLNHYGLSSINAIREFQLVQHSLTHIELKLALARPLTVEEHEKIDGIFKKEAGDVFQTSVTFHESLERTAVGKLRAFVSHISRP